MTLQQAADGSCRRSPSRQRTLASGLSSSSCSPSRRLESVQNAQEADSQIRCPKPSDFLKLLVLSQIVAPYAILRQESPGIRSTSVRRNIASFGFRDQEGMYSVSDALICLERHDVERTVLLGSVRGSPPLQRGAALLENIVTRATSCVRRAADGSARRPCAMAAFSPMRR